MSEVQLPEGWVWKKLGQVVKLSSEKYQPSGKEEFYIGLEHIEKGTGKISLTAGTEQINTVKNKYYPGELLYGKLRPNLNKAVIAPREGVCSTDILVFRPTGQVEIRYLHLLMITRQFVNEASANTAGVNLPRVSTKYLENYQIPLPSLPVQQAIVARIEELFSELEAGVKELKTALARLKTYRQAVLHHYLNNPDWERVKLGEIADRITDGEHITPRRTEEGVYLLSARNIRNGYISLTKVDYIPEDEYQRIIKRCNPQSGDILISCSGSIGRVCMVPDHLVFTMVRSVALVKLQSKRHLSKFLEYQLRGPQVQIQIRKLQKATAQANLFIGPIKQIEVLLPPAENIPVIVAEIEAVMSEADVMETTIRQELVRAENLRQSILKQAFEGKLVAGPVKQAEPKELAGVSEPVSPVYGGQGDQLTLF